MSRRMTSLVVLAFLLLIGAFLAPIASANSPAPDANVPDVALVIDPSAAPQQVPAQQDEVTGVFDGLASIFAILGIYIVTMFTMSIAVEVVVDIIKISIGLKSKPSARKTLADYQNLLPGTLDDLGASAQAQVKLSEQIKALNTLLAPVYQAEEIIVHVRNKEFDEAFNSAFGAEAQGKWVNEARDLLKEHLHTAVSAMTLQSPLGKSIQLIVTNNLDNIINQAANEAAALTPNQVYDKSIALIKAEYATATTQWAEAKLLELQRVPYQTAQTIYEFQLKPEIEKSGLSQNLQDALNQQFVVYLSNLQKFKLGEEYLAALNSLLLDVEKAQDQLYTRISLWWLRIKRWTRRQFSRIFPSLKNPPSTKMRNIIIESPAVAANRLMEIDERDKQENNVRINQLRFISVVVGIALAYMLRVDSADLLRGLFPGDSADFLYITLLAEDSALLMWINSALNISAPAVTAGILLTGLGASAGSNFWHQQLGRLENVKQTTDTARAAIQPIIVQAQGGKVSQSNPDDAA